MTAIGLGVALLIVTIYLLAHLLWPILLWTVLLTLYIRHTHHAGRHRR